MSEEISPAAAPLLPLEPIWPLCWLNAASNPQEPIPVPFTRYQLGEILKPYEPPVFLTKRDPWRSEPKPRLKARRTKKVSPLTIIAFKLLQKLPEVRRDENGNLVPAGVALW